MNPRRSVHPFQVLYPGDLLQDTKELCMRPEDSLSNQA
jgi:hypothetical protein